MRKLIVICGVIISFASNAQTKGSAIVMRGGYGHSRGTEKLYTDLSEGAVTKFTNRFSLLGIEFYHKRDKWVASAEATGGTQKARPSGMHSLKPYNGAGHIRLGYILYEGKEWWFYPSAGIGASMISLSEREKLSGKISKIDDVHMYTPSFDFGLNMDLLTTKETKNQKRAGGLVLGLRTGYRFSTKSNNWRNSDGAHLNESGFRNNEYYLILVVGGGFFHSK